MSQFRWSKSDIEEARRMRNRHPQPASYQDIADMFSRRWNRPVHKEQVRSALRRDARLSQRGWDEAEIEYVPSYDTVPELVNAYVREEEPSKPVPPALSRFSVKPVERKFEPLHQFESRSVCVIADLHVPYHNAKLLERVVDMIRLFGCDTLVIAGDLTDQAEMSRHPKNEAGIMRLREELLLAGDVILHLCELLGAPHIQPLDLFKVKILNGNHDERVAKRLDTHFHLNDLISIALNRRVPVCPVDVIDRDFVRANVYGSPWVFGHFDRYKPRAGDKARELAAKYQANVAGGHDHIQGFTSSACGKFICISTGSMIHINDDGETSFYYQERRFNTYPATQNGFLIVHEGIPFLFNEHGGSPLNGGKPWEYYYELGQR